MAWFTATIGTCNEYMDDTAEKKLVSVVLTPLRVLQTFSSGQDRMERIYWGCSKFFHCQNLKCEFSLGSQNERRSKKEARQT